MNNRCLFISFHGGGGTRKEINDKQYKNQQHLYDKILNKMDFNGIYLTLRAATNSWDMFHQKQIDKFINIIIKLCVIKLNVNLNKIHLLGYSAGGDGVYRIGTRLANKFAAISMMAGHPGNCTPNNLFNTPFVIHIGEMDQGYNRLNHALKWKQKFNKLKINNNGYYKNCNVVIHKNKGHWMEWEDSVALKWMIQFERNPYPKLIKWRQENVENIEFYWLSVKEEFIKQNGEIIIECGDFKENKIDILENYAKEINIHLNEKIVDINEEIEICFKGKRIFKGLLKPKLIDIWHCYQFSGDVDRLFCVSLTVIDNNKVVRYVH